MKSHLVSVQAAQRPFPHPAIHCRSIKTSGDLIFVPKAAQTIRDLIDESGSYSVEWWDGTVTSTTVGGQLRDAEDGVAFKSFHVYATDENDPLVSLTLQNAELTILNLVECSLHIVQCGNNNLMVLDMTGQPVTTLVCDYNFLTTLSVLFTGLQVLTASNNFLQNVTVATNLLLNVRLNNNSLDAISVDGAFNACNAAAPNGQAWLDGGTSAPPTNASLAKRTALIANGWDVRFNA